MADETAVAVVPSPTHKPLESLTGEERQEWRKTGNVPEVPPKSEAPAASDPPVEAKSAEAIDKEASETAPETEPGKVERRRKPAAEQRIAELVAETKELKRQLDAARSSPKPEGTRTAEPSTASAKEKSADDPEPSFEDFTKQGKSYEEWVKAQAKWEARQEARSLIKQERESAQKAAKDAEVAKANQEKAEVWRKRVGEAIKRHPDFVEVAFDKELSIPEGSPTDEFVLLSEHGPEILYHLAQNREELERISGLNRTAQFVELAKLEISLSGKPAAQPKKISTAPKPPSEVGGKGTPPGDEVEDAVKKGNFGAYKASENARELRARKG